MKKVMGGSPDEYSDASDDYKIGIAVLQRLVALGLVKDIAAVTDHERAFLTRYKLAFEDTLLMRMALLKIRPERRKYEIELADYSSWERFLIVKYQTYYQDYLSGGRPKEIKPNFLRNHKYMYFQGPEGGFTKKEWYDCIYKCRLLGKRRAERALKELKEMEGCRGCHRERNILKLMKSKESGFLP
ncbi:MAG: hypothetical protein CSYNP_02816 [Syntrophus sp. SKADARSKE-3]|nr:hypothetical protein [Syntrophus sp. SKADARSKE-3]